MVLGNLKLLKMKRNIYIVTILLTFLTSYACDSFKNDKIDEYVESVFLKCDDKEKCVVDFNSLLDYDKIYIFGVGATNEEVSKAIGFQYNGDKDISRLILFVKNNQVVFEQNIVFDPDSNPYKVIFDSDKVVFNNTTKFIVTKDSERDTYVLQPLE